MFYNNPISFFNVVTAPGMSSDRIYVFPDQIALIEAQRQCFEPGKLSTELAGRIIKIQLVPAPQNKIIDLVKIFFPNKMASISD